MSSPTEACVQPHITPTSLPLKLPLLSDFRYVAVTLVVIVFAGSALRMCQLTARSFWYDEGFSARLIEFPFPEMLQRIGQDIHPPLYYLLLRGWSSVFGESDYALRALSALFGVLTILGAYLFAVEAFGKDYRRTMPNADLRVRGRGIGLLAAALVALSALQIHYSQETRMYSLAAALAMFSSWALFRALTPPSHLRRWILFGLFALLLLYTHYYGLFTLAVQVLFVAALLLVRAEWRLTRLLRDPALPHVVFTAAVVIAIWLPWVPVFLQQRAQVQSVSISGRDVSRLCYNLFTAREQFFDAPPSLGRLLASGVCVLVLLLLHRKARAAQWYVLCSAVAPLIFCLAVSAPLAMRYFIMAHTFLLVGLAVVIWGVPFHLERAIVLVSALAIFAGLYSDYWRDLDAAHRPGARGAAALLREHRRPGEPVIVCMPLFYFPLLHYAQNRAGYYLHSDGRPMPYSYGTPIMTPEDLITDEQIKTLRSRRVWTVNMEDSFLGISWVPVLPQWREKSRHVFPEVARLGNLIVVEYENVASHEDEE